jgi:hypothetical protein
LFALSLSNVFFLEPMSNYRLKRRTNREVPLMSVPTSQFSIPSAVMIYHHHLSAAAEARQERSATLVAYHEAEAQKAAEQLARQGYQLAPPVQPAQNQAAS